MLKHYLSEEVLDRNTRANKAKTALALPANVNPKQTGATTGASRVREMFTGVFSVFVNYGVPGMKALL